MKQTDQTAIKASIESAKARAKRNGRYLVLDGMSEHPLAGSRGRIPLHRYICFESLGAPTHSPCAWCGYVLPWKTNVGAYLWSAVCVDHLDNDSQNNEPENLVPACAWCNANRQWAERHAKFWSDWRRWLGEVPPPYRPNLPMIAKDFGIEVFDSSETSLP